MLCLLLVRGGFSSGDDDYNGQLVMQGQVHGNARGQGGGVVSGGLVAMQNRRWE